jgi:putative endonuclease
LPTHNEQTESKTFGRMNVFDKLKATFIGKVEPEHLRLGKIGELAAKKYLQKRGMKFLAANFRSEHGEIDLIFREPIQMSSTNFFIGNESNCLVFVEVKARSSEEWSRPAAAVDAERRRRLSQCGLDYLRLLKNPRAKIRFDIVEVLLADGKVLEIRHLPNTFTMSRPFRYG